MIINVVVNNNSFSTDKLYSYKVSDDMKVSLGDRLLVPFGISNKPLEAFCWQIDVKSDFKRIKSVLDTLDEKQFLSKKQIELVEWMRLNYLCTYMDIIQMMMPSGKKFINEKFVKLLIRDFSNLKKEEYIFLKKIKEKNCKILVSELTNKEIKLAKKLKEDKFVDICWEYEEKNLQKYKITIYLKKCNFDIISELKRKKYFKQVEVLEFLIQNKYVEKKDLVNILNVSDSTIKSLLKKDLIEIKKEEIFRKIDSNYEEEKKEIFLKDFQKKAILHLKEKIKKNEKPCILKGVTGSGKTEIYIELAKEMIKNGKNVLILVPEISLTPQTAYRFKKIFKDEIIVYHSSLSLGEKYDQWNKIKNGDAKIVVGARSSLFLPFKNLGLAIIDEFQESSYKSESRPHYNAIEVCEYLSKNQEVFLLLGSATPTIEHYYKAINNDYDIIVLNQRVNQKKLPTIEIVDMKNELLHGNRSIFSNKLIQEMKLNFEKGYQSILFLNRRGYSNFICCRECGEVVKCNSCDISMTYHKDKDKLICHYCGEEKNIPKTCSNCNSDKIKDFGIGTQKIQEELVKIFPKAKIIRMDKDTTRKKGSHENLINQFSKDGDILIGTQMISKGLDFPKVALVGVLLADMMLKFPDYKSSEKTFQNIIQVSGRAGRDKIAGKVFLQAYDVDHYALKFAQRYDFEGFYEREIKIRKFFEYKPFNNMISVLIQSENEIDVHSTALKIKEALVYLLAKKGFFDLEFILGPMPCPIEKIKNLYRWQIIIKDKGIEFDLLKHILRYICISKSKVTIQGNTNVQICINPENLI